MPSTDSYHAAHHGAALAGRTDRGVIRVRGADAAEWLQGLLTNDIDAIRPIDPDGPLGTAGYGAYLTPQGRMITDARVVRMADRLLLDVPASLVASLVQRLDALIFAEDVQVEDVSAAIVVLELHGPRALDLVTGWRASGRPGQAIVARDDQYGMPGIVFHVDSAERHVLEAALEAAGAVPIDLPTLDVVRIESGCPAFLIDMETDTIPLEAGIEDRAISFTKGCYVGQEIIVRVTQRGGGRVARKLVGFTIDSRDRSTVPARGTIVRAGDRDIGRVTSATFSATLDRVIALGYAHRDFVSPGTRVTIGGVDAVVAATPFVATATTS